MVHWQNIAYILANGLCCREHINADPNYVDIGHRKLIGDRHDHPIDLDGAGNLGEYIPFYFAGHSPMLYVIKNGYLGVKQTPQEDIVFIVCDFDVIDNSELEYIFTDRNAKLDVVKFFRDKSDFDKLKWDIIHSKDWKNTPEDFTRKDHKQAEFLIRNNIPIDCFFALVVKNETKRAEIEEIVSNLGLQIPVRIENPGRLYY